MAVREFGKDARFRFYRGSYIEMEQCVALAGVQQVNGVLLDLGVSSPQLDDANRGFSFLERRSSGHAYGSVLRHDGG